MKVPMRACVWTFVSVYLSTTLSQNDHTVRQLGSSSISNKILREVYQHHSISCVNGHTVHNGSRGIQYTSLLFQHCFSFTTWTWQEQSSKQLYFCLSMLVTFHFFTRALHRHKHFISIRAVQSCSRIVYVADIHK